MEEVKNYWLQSVNAAYIEEVMIRKMLQEGWIYNKTTGEFTHPNKPNEILLRG